MRSSIPSQLDRPGRPGPVIGSTYRPGCDCRSCDDQRTAILDARQPRVLTEAPPTYALEPAYDEQRLLGLRLLARREIRD